MIQTRLRRYKMKFNKLHHHEPEILNRKLMHHLLIMSNCNPNFLPERSVLVLNNVNTDGNGLWI
jgi:hypothetical protein